jgi:hypothetical protein
MKKAFDELPKTSPYRSNPNAPARNIVKKKRQNESEKPRGLTRYYDHPPVIAWSSAWFYPFRSYQTIVRENHANLTLETRT